MTIGKKISILIFSILLHNLSKAQLKAIDSIRNLLPGSQKIEKVNCLNALSRLYLGRQTDSALIYASLAYWEAEHIEYSVGKGDALMNLGKAFSARKKKQEAGKSFMAALSIFEKIHDENKLGAAYLNLGLNNGIYEQRDQTIQYFENASQHFLNSNDSVRNAYAMTMLGLMYGFKGEYDKAFDYHNKSLEIGRMLNNRARINYALNNLGILFMIVEDYRTALDYFLQAATQIPYYDKIAESYYKLGQRDSALYFMEKFVSSYKSNLAETIAIRDTALVAAHQMDLNLAEANLLLMQENYDLALEKFIGFERINGTTSQGLSGIVKCYLQKNDYVNALKYANQLLASAIRNQERMYVRDGTRFLWQIYHHNKKYDSAYVYFLRYTDLKDSIANYRFIRQLSALREKSTMETSELRHRQESEKKDLVFKQTLQKESFIKNILVVSLVVLALLIFIVLWNIRLRIKNEKLELEKFNHQLSLQGLENEKKQAELLKKSSELEMQVLRTQMNPHFIFNSLNSINRFILQNNKGQASQYLTKFSKLVRLILQNSQEELISLESEIESLELYLDLESLRFNYHFNYKISLQPDLDISGIKVPPLIIQPYVENAIWHGLMHMEEIGQLDVEIRMEGNFLYCRIADNGIGRKKSSEMSSKSSARHKSMGLHITSDRIALIQKEEAFGPAVKIFDLTNPDGSAAGTEVTIRLPLMFI